MQRTQKKVLSNSVGDANMMKFYVDESPGVKLQPSVVLVMAVSYIGIVVLLHIVGKLLAPSKSNSVPTSTEA